MVAGCCKAAAGSEHRSRLMAVGYWPGPGQRSCIFEVEGRHVKKIGRS